MEDAVVKFLGEPLVIFGILSGLCTALYKFALWKGAVEEGRTTVADFMKEIRDDIKKIFDRLPETPAAVQATSPLRLTKFGESLSRAINGKQWAERLCQSGELKDRLEGKSNYEIQESCIQYTASEMPITDEEKLTLQQCAYDHGVEELVVRRVLGIELRDKLMESMKENLQ